MKSGPVVKEATPGEFIIRWLAASEITNKGRKGSLSKWESVAGAGKTGERTESV